jgi:hypothetical protein
MEKVEGKQRTYKNEDKLCQWKILDIIIGNSWINKKMNNVPDI